jgi:hypothetical protein
MHRLWPLCFSAIAASLVGGCSSSPLPSLAGASAQPSTSIEGVRKTGQPDAFESAVMVSGSPAGIYALVARGALNCWLGADGPLRASHVFAAAAAPPSQGGAAEIVLHERDPSLRDQRGPRALRLSFEQVQGNVRVGISNLRLPVALAEAMSRDAAAWAKGDGGCRAQEMARIAEPQAGAATKLR